MIDIRPTDALIIVDPQNDFCEGGALAVAGANEIMFPIVNMAHRFSKAGATVVITEDNHPRDHKSFASAHGLEPFAEIDMPYGRQTLWPDHCVQGTWGQKPHMVMENIFPIINMTIRKGMNPNIDSYSAFMENDQKTVTGLGGFLHDRRISRVFCVGLAYDFCVGFSAIDATRNESFDAFVIKDLTRAIAMPLATGKTTVDAIERTFSEVGVEVINSGDIQ